MAAALVARARAHFEREKGQALIEYALIVSLLAILAVGGMTLLGGGIGAMFSDIADTLRNP